MATNSELLATFQSMRPGENLLVLDSTVWPGQNETGKIGVGILRIFPSLDVIVGKDQYPLPDNPLLRGKDGLVTVSLARNSREFVRERTHTIPISVARGAGTILGLTVDLAVLDPWSSDPAYFIGKPRE